MRTIKFRAWNEQLKQMEYCTHDEYWMILNDDSSIHWGLYHRRDGHRLLSGEHNPPLMQFTGLHDGTKWEQLTEKEREAWTLAGNMPSEWKGKEIYEGDIVRFSDTFTEWDSEVLYDSSAAAFGMRGGNTYTSGIIQPFADYDELTDLLPFIEVIGNIYQNQELLK